MLRLRARIRTQPLHRRLVVVIIVVCTVVLNTCAAVTVGVLRDSLFDRLDEQLDTTAAALRALDTRERSNAPMSLDPGVWLEYPGGLYVALAVVHRQPQGPGPRLSGPLPASGATFTTGSAQPGSRESFRVRVQELTDGRTALVALSVRETEAAADHALYVVLATVGIALPTLALLAALFVRRELRPLERAARVADTIAAGDYARRVHDPLIGPRTEVGRLAIALDRMLDGIQAALAARDASRERLRRFVADASHELRNPLQSIGGYAELYQRGALPDRAAVDDAVSRMRAEIRRMNGLVEALLLLARLDEEQDTDLEPVDLTRVVADSCRDAAAVEPDRPLTCAGRPAEDRVGVLGDEDRVSVLGDEDRLRQLVANLLGNVRMHTPVHTPAEVELRAADGEAVLIVRDRGPGIPDADLPHVFDRFHRADKSRSRTQGGSGLGLSIVAAIVEMHHGTITIGPAPGGGTVVEVRLPALAEADAEAGSGPGRAGGTGGPIRRLDPP
ncbi:sensor histidine kinase [Embleya hyalina]|uniref:histidine kinase n=1 Tax=Embleya hyalina TaxID=516124 RepID=A0A401Z045_9ACTN|nr:HAMP domain-containing sensor histidine kinase [Embleya hyalina]GCE00188.1 two-component sensor histidine kinase [Embleya hyalina]